MNKIIFGGAFDPIHNGHINMALNAAKTLDGEVIFVPARISVWKNSSCPIKEKIEMLNLAIENHPTLSIDTYEIDSNQEINYSIDTVRYFKNKYPNDKLYYLIGADQVNEFHRWKEAEELSSLAQLVFYSRPGYQLDNKNIKTYKMIQIEGGGIEVSSTDIRDFRSFELPYKVLLYIVEHNLYKGMEVMHMLLSDKRLNHSIEVGKLAYKIAVRNNFHNPMKAFVAGLFHDIGKETPEPIAESIMKSNYLEYINMPQFSFHQFVGEYLAQVKFGITDQEILTAIRNHATGNKDMSELSKIIYASDKIEPTRGFDSKDLINAMMKDVDSGFKIVLEANKEFLLSHNKNINNPLTSICFEQYLK